jgi:acetylglutamate kinase
MKDFDLRKYLAENKLLKEEIMVNPIIMFGGKDYIKNVLASPDDYGHFPEDAEWIKSNILTAPKMMSIQDYMDLDDEWVKQAQIEVGSGADLDHIVDALKVHVEQGLITPEQKDEAMKVVGLA